MAEGFPALRWLGFSAFHYLKVDRPGESELLNDLSALADLDLQFPC
jgi:hypothetical protein